MPCELTVFLCPTFLPITILSQKTFCNIIFYNVNFCLSSWTHIQDDMCNVYHRGANANTKPSFRPPPPPISLFVLFCLTPPPPPPPSQQYTTDDLDYSQFYDYSEGPTDTVPTDEYAEPQVNETEKRENVSCCVSLCHVFLDVNTGFPQKQPLKRVSITT